MKVHELINTYQIQIEVKVHIYLKKIENFFFFDASINLSFLKFWYILDINIFDYKLI